MENGRPPYAGKAAIRQRIWLLKPEAEDPRALTKKTKEIK